MASSAGDGRMGLSVRVPVPVPVPLVRYNVTATSKPSFIAQVSATASTVAMRTHQ